MVDTNRIELMLLKKNEETNEYVNTAWNPGSAGWNNNVYPGTSNDVNGVKEIEIQIGGFDAGSYCIKATLVDDLSYVSEANYYFIID